MEEVLHLCCPSEPRLLSHLRPGRSPPQNAPFCPLFRLPPSRALCSSSATPRSLTLPTPKRPPKPPSDVDRDEVDLDDGLLAVFPHMDSSTFREKVLFLDSLGVDLLAVSPAHPCLLSTPLEDLRATADFLLNIGGFTPSDLHRICGMCPEVLTIGGPRALAPVFRFLFCEAGVGDLRGLRLAVRRRPRLLVSSVAARLRPTLYFLQMLGVPDVGRRHASLLSCSVEDKLLPRIEYLQGIGFSPREVRGMLRKFPQLFCYSIAGNLEPKFNFLTMEMGRSLRELRKFPQYFSFSLKERIAPRHQRCQEAGVLLPLPALLKPADKQFEARLEVCISSSPPLRRSPLWCQGLTSKCSTCNSGGNNNDSSRS